MNLSPFHIVLLFLFTFICELSFAQSGNYRIVQIGQRKYLYDGKGYLDNAIKKVIIHEKKGDPLYDGIIYLDRVIDVRGVLGASVSAYLLYAGISLESNRPDLGLGKYYIAGGGIGLLISLIYASKYEWVLNDLPAAIDIWNQNIDQDLSNIPNATFGITSSGIGLNYNF